MLFESTVNRALVHRSALSEVLLTDWHSVGSHDFLLGAQWPRGHSFYLPIGGRWFDPLLMAETVRQAGLLIAHGAFGVPLDSQFLLEDLNYYVDPAGLAHDGAPANLSLMLACSDVRTRRSTIAGMRVRVHVLRDGSPLGVGDGLFSCTSASVYRRLRGDRIGAKPPAEQWLPQPIRPRLVGRDRLADVVLAPLDTPGAWAVRAHPDHPVLFDHHVDHLPGMTLVEAMRQAACLVTSCPQLLVTGLDVRFTRYVEFDRPCVVRAEARRARQERTRVNVVVEQDGEPAATGTLTVRAAG